VTVNVQGPLLRETCVYLPDSTYSAVTVDDDAIDNVDHDDVIGTR